MSQSESGLPIPVVITGVALVLGYLLWGIGCSMYIAGYVDPQVEAFVDQALADEEVTEEELADIQEAYGERVTVDFVGDGMPVRIRRPGTGTAGAVAVLGVIVFLITSIQYLSEAGSVLSFLFAERMWFIILSAVLMVGVLFGGLYMAKLQAELESGSAFRKKRKKT